MKQVVLWTLLILIIIFLYCGYDESSTNYDLKYGIIYGNVIDSDTEKINITSSEHVSGIDLFISENLYRIKYKYKYVINNKVYHGHFYNDDVDNDDKLTLTKAKKLRKKFNKNYPLRIYFLKSDNSQSCISVDYAKDKNSKFYYGFAFVLFIIVLLILFFSNFSIYK